MATSKRAAPGYAAALRWLSWAIGVLALASVFGAYAAVAVLVNPFVPFHLAPQIWRLLYAGAGLWLIADHLGGP